MDVTLPNDAINMS